MSKDKSQNSMEYIVVGTFMKPFGLIGEIKVRPESFDLNRHEQLKNILVEKKSSGLKQELKISSSRLHQNLWYFKLEGFTTPEAVKPLTGATISIPEVDKLEIADDEIYTSDIYEFDVMDETGKKIGQVKEVQETGAQDIIHVDGGKEEPILIPWVEHFVKNIDTEKKVVSVDYSSLRSLYED